MPFSLSLPRFVLCFLSVLPIFAWAQTPDSSLAAPPPMHPLEEDLEPQVTIFQDERGQVQEYRAGGRLYMVKVVPENGVPYYLIDKNGDGVMETKSDLDPGLSLPMWIIGTF